jgi:hypothetical protein
MSLKTRLCWLGFATVIGIGGGAGCGIAGLSGPSTVAQGRYYASGSPEFDRFFRELHQFQVRLGAAPDEWVKHRAVLVKTAAADDSAPSLEIAEKLHGQLEKLVARGIRVKLELAAPDKPGIPPSVVNLKTSGNPGASERELLTAVDRALNGLAKLHAEMSSATPRLGELHSLATQLDGQVNEAPDLGGPSKRREVRRNLSDATQVIALMTERSRSIGAQSGELVKWVVEKAGTDDGSVGSSPASPIHAPPSPGPGSLTSETPHPAPNPERPPPVPERVAPPPAPAPRPAPPPPEPKPKETPKPKPAPKPAEFEP